MDDRVEVAVVGLGAMGATALWVAASSGLTAAGLDALEPPHDRGSSHGESRVFRTAYSEGTFYVPLLQRSLALWRDLEAESGAELFTATGALLIGPPDSDTVRGALASARAHRLEHRLLDATALRREYPQHAVDEGSVAVHETQAGVLRPERCIATALERARALGARVETGARVTAVRPHATGIDIAVDGGGVVRADRVIVAAGAWSGRLLPALSAALTVERQVMAWFPCEDPQAFAPQRFPVFIHDIGAGRLRYGLPTLDGRTVKVAVHHEGAAAHPDHLDRTVGEADLAPLREFVAGHLRGLGSDVAAAVVCMYTNTPDEHLMVGAVPSQPGVIALGGCSGHSFKLAPAMAEVAVACALGEPVPPALAPLDVSRLAPGR